MAAKPQVNSNSPEMQPKRDGVEYFKSINGLPVDWQALVSNSVMKGANTNHHYFSGWMILYKGKSAGYIHLRKMYVKGIPNDIESKIDRFLSRQGLPENSLILSVGRILHPQFRKLGIGTEVLKLVTQFGLKELGADAGYFRVSTFHNDGLDWYSAPDIES